MDSLWELGEYSGERGPALAIHKITCAFCLETGNFSPASNFFKQRANSNKRIHFTTLKCEHCAGYVLVMWSANSNELIHDFRVLPAPLRVVKAPEDWPSAVARYWMQAQR